MFRTIQTRQPIATSTVSKNLRCTANYNIPQLSSTTSTLTERDFSQFADLNIDLKELNNLLTGLNKNKTKKNNNLRKVSKKKSSTQSNRNSIERQYREEELKLVKNIKKILSEKIKAKTLQRLDRLIKRPKDGRLNKVACVIKALLEVLNSCVNVPISTEELIRKYKDKIAKEYPAGSNGAEEFIKDILEKNDTSLKDFITKQITHNKQLGEKLVTTIKDLPTCSV
jgi:hypothetical protein